MLRQGEDARDSRRRDFLQNVRRKAEDKAWERRDIEGKVSARAARRAGPGRCRCPTCANVLGA